MGALPSPGQWVRLEVPARIVDLEGRSIKGMSFSVHGGRVTWDAAGKMSDADLLELENVGEYLRRVR